ncbi:anhydro-N-acetylmuramic acid kinase [bacterium]|nr:anhydro-N-acetylmuramic acid kinase [bacterium]
MGKQQKLNILGLMSGTSGDGIDGALVKFESGVPPALLWHESMIFPKKIQDRIKHLMVRCNAQQLAQASTFISELYSQAVEVFRKKHSDLIDLLAAHGQTLAHVPSPAIWEDKTVFGSLQALNPGYLAERTGLSVASDFRSRDMAAGGQGAPLVPFGDLCFFGSIPGDSVILNIGGIANITVIRHGKEPFVEAAFDTGPGNMLIDQLAYEASNGRKAYDSDGAIAFSGKTNGDLLESLLQDPYFAQLPPKSTGREQFGVQRLKEIRDDWKNKISTANLMSTLLDLTVDSIVLALKSFVLPFGDVARLVISGGGALNKELIRRLNFRIPAKCEVEFSDAYGIPTLAREAMGFAALGNALILGIPANIPVATGARKKVLLGSLTPGSNLKDLLLNSILTFEPTP